MSNIKQEMMNEKDFVDIYKPISRSPNGDNIIQNIDIADAFANKHGLGETNIWTIVDFDGHFFAYAGLHRLSRLGYVVTQYPWITGNEKAAYYLGEPELQQFRHRWKSDKE